MQFALPRHTVPHVMGLLIGEHNICNFLFKHPSLDLSPINSGLCIWVPHPWRAPTSCSWAGDKITLRSHMLRFVTDWQTWKQSRRNTSTTFASRCSTGRTFWDWRSISNIYQRDPTLLMMIALSSTESLLRQSLDIRWKCRHIVLANNSVGTTHMIRRRC